MSVAPAALLFDVFGTVVDWRSSIAAEVRQRGLPVDPEAFADAWRAGYAPAMARVRSGELPWTTIDALHRGILDGLLARHGLRLSDTEAVDLNRAWHRLAPWPDSVEGLTRLKRRQPIATLSNGNVSLLLDMARHAGLPWDLIFSAELFGHYKPDAEVYLGAARLLDLAPSSVLMVAAHPGDLRAAARCGLRTALVLRPDEHGPAGPPEAWQDGEFDRVVPDLPALAAALGA